MIDGALHAEAPERFPDNRGRDHAQTQKVETRLPPASEYAFFGPLAGIDDGTIVMTVEEYETIRLSIQRIDQRRTNGCTPYGPPRSCTERVITVDCLVNSRRLIIEGGDYLVCNAREMTCGCPHCRRLIQPADGETPTITP